jgi:hypothetical protein
VTSARDTVNQSLRVLTSPIPWPKKTRRRNRTVIFGGGCLFWLLIGWVVFFGYLLWAMAIVCYIFLLYVFRFYFVLGCLAWWGIDSSMGVAKRAKRHRDVKRLPPPPDHLAA